MSWFRRKPKVLEVPLEDGGMGYVYAPYIPIYHDLSALPLSRRIWYFVWWRQLFGKLRNLFRRKRSWQMRYAAKRIDPSMYRRINLAPPPSDAEVEKQIEEIIERSVRDVIEKDKP